MTARDLPELPASLDEVHVYMGARSDDCSRWAAPAADYYNTDQMHQYAIDYAAALAGAGAVAPAPVAVGVDELRKIADEMMECAATCDDIGAMGAHVVGFVNRITAALEAKPHA